MTPRIDQEGPVLAHVAVELRDLILGFLDNCHKDMRALRTALAQEDYETVRHVGNGMQGCGSGYGFPAVMEIGRGLEEAARSGDVEAMRTGVEILADYLARVEIVYE